MNPHYQHEFMQQAIRTAEEGMKTGQAGPFGAVVVLQNREIIAAAHNGVVSNSDPSAHAEVQAIRAACSERGHFELRDCVLYSSCEPCPMCLGAIYWARLAKVYFASTRQQAAAAGFDDAFIYEQLAVPAAQRTIPCICAPTDEADSLFVSWQESDSKVVY